MSIDNQGEDLCATTLMQRICAPVECLSALCEGSKGLRSQGGAVKGCHVAVYPHNLVLHYNNGWAFSCANAKSVGVEKMLCKVKRLAVRGM